MIMLNEELMQEIVEGSNYESIKHVEESIATGDIEVYANKEEYEKVGYDFRFEQYYTTLTNGAIAHFIGG